MKKRIVFFCICFIISLNIWSKGDDNWFMAQTKKAPISSITATSELIEAQYEGKYIYPPINIVDGNLDNTWCESVQDGPGIGEAITIEFTVPFSFDEIQIVNGFAYKDYYKKNNRVKSIQITQVAKKHFQQKTYELKDDCPSWQSINFEYTQTAQTITFKILDVYKGNKYDDTCLDDIRFLYKGNVIPFENVAEIKKVQEENSKLLLKSDSKAFKEQFLSLGKTCKNPEYSVILLMNDNKKDGIYIELINNRIVSFDECQFYKPNTSYDEIKKDWEYWYISDFKVSEKLPSFVRLPNYRSADYTIGNFNIIKDETIDYVTTTSSILIKLDGKKSIYINGIHYSVIDYNDYQEYKAELDWY